jgi:hypothetical protein
MSLVQNRPLAQCDTPAAAIEELCAGFDGFASGEPAFEQVAAADVPSPYSRLLVHNQHMTSVLGDYHGTPVDLYVLGVRQDGDYYTRKIFLTPRGSAQATELGVARVNLRCLRESTRNEIIEARRPLGAVLASHERFRRIEPRWFLRFPRGSPVLRWFGFPDDGPFYGRIGTIYCTGEVAIELLEIVTVWSA